MAGMDDTHPEQQYVSARALQTAVFGSAGFRDESGQPLVYGYVCSTAGRPRHVAACRRAVERYCQRERLQLCTMFTDTRFADTRNGDDLAIRPGLIGLCDVLRLPDSFAAVLVGINHLSLDSRMAEQLIRQIRDTGARLLLLRPPRGATSEPNTRCTQALEWWQ
jgi:hypothetical protein